MSYVQWFLVLFVWALGMLLVLFLMRGGSDDARDDT
jgi:hypothetical protein